MIKEIRKNSYQRGCNELEKPCFLAVTEETQGKKKQKQMFLDTAGNAS